MSPQRRAALVSVGAAVALVALKLSVGIAAHSLGLISEAIHSGVDLVAALLTFFAVGVAGRPADPSHQYGHGKAEHLAALAEAAFLALASVFIAVRAVERLTGSSSHSVNAAWYALAVVGVVIVVDVSRTLVSWRAARRYQSAALASNALHFASDLTGSIAVLAGLLLARAGHPQGDSYAALFVAVLVLLAASRLARGNIDVLMDRAPTDAEDAARAAIAALPEVVLRRLRMRHAGGRQFADVVIAVSPEAAVGQGHAAAVAVPGVREVHNLALVDIGGRTALSLHLKLPGDVSLEAAHEVAEDVERAIRAAVPGVDAVQTHLEPLTEPAAAHEVVGDKRTVERIVLEATGRLPRELRFLRTDAGLVAFLTLGLDGAGTLADAHARASQIEERIRGERPDIDEVIVHTEP